MLPFKHANDSAHVQNIVAEVGISNWIDVYMGGGNDGWDGGEYRDFVDKISKTMQWKYLTNKKSSLSSICVRPYQAGANMRQPLN